MSSIAELNNNVYHIIIKIGFEGWVVNIPTENLLDNQALSKDQRLKEDTIEELLRNSNELEEIEEMSNEFNPFSVLKVGTLEIRHSNMISWLFSTKESHMLGDLFFKRLLNKLMVMNKEYFTKKHLDFFDLELLNYSNFYIEREHHTHDGALDILMWSDKDKIAIIIENKVKSELGNEQLERYFRYGEDKFKEYERIYILLSPKDSILEEKDVKREHWIILLYNEIIVILVEIMNIRKTNIQPEVKMFLNHYIETVRREILGNSELERKCLQLYNKYPNAFKAINEFMPNQELNIKDFCVAWISKHPELVEDVSTKTYIRFIPKSLADIEAIKIAKDYTSTRRVLLFEIENKIGIIILKLMIGPVDINNETHKKTRRKVYDAVLLNGTKPESEYNKNYSTIFKEPLYRVTNENTLEFDEICKQIEIKLNKFCTHDILKYEGAILKALLEN